jgi:F0F1-type ATP synthase assembly protein I
VTNEPGEQDPDATERRQLTIQMTALGLEFSGSVLGGLIGGYYLDEWLGTKPWLLLIGVFGGLVTAVARLLVLTKRFQQIRDGKRR